MENQVTDKAKIRKIDEQLTELSISLEAAQCVMDDISQSYFNSVDPTDEQTKLKIIWEYNRHSKLSNIVVDYLNRAQETLERMTKDVQ